MDQDLIKVLLVDDHYFVKDYVFSSKTVKDLRLLEKQQMA